MSFEQAWTMAVRPGRAVVMTTNTDPPAGGVLWPTDSRDRVQWRAEIGELKDDYRRAYEQRPATARERAVAALSPLLTELSAAAERAPTYGVFARARAHFRPGVDTEPNGGIGRVWKRLPARAIERERSPAR